MAIAFLQVITLSFSETMDASTVVFGAFTIIGDQVPTSAQHTLTDGTVLSLDGTLLAIQLSVADTESLKMKSIALTQAGTNLAIGSDAVRDMFNLNINAIPKLNPLAVKTYSEDKVRPSLLHFSLDVNLGELQLTFSETVETSALDVTALTIQGTADGSGQAFNLTGLSATTSLAGAVVIVSIANSDLNEVKKLEACATSAGDTFLSFTSALITDRNANPVIAVGSDVAQPVQHYTADTTKPQLVAFSVNMDAEYLDSDLGSVVGCVEIAMTFTETVDISTLLAKFLTVQAESVTAADSVTLGGRATVITQSDSTVLSFKTLRSDANQIKQNSNLAISSGSSFVSLAANFIQDMAGNSNVVIPTTSALRAEKYNPDTTAPRLLSFSINVDRGSITMSFDETVDGTSLEPVELSIMDFVSRQAASVTLTGGIGTTGIPWVQSDTRSTFDHSDADAVTLWLTKTDLDELKRQNVCTSQDDCYLVHTGWAIRDMNRNQIIACT